MYVLFWNREIKALQEIEDNPYVSKFIQLLFYWCWSRVIHVHRSIHVLSPFWWDEKTIKNKYSHISKDSFKYNKNNWPFGSRILKKNLKIFCAQKFNLLDFDLGFFIHFMFRGTEALWHVKIAEFSCRVIQICS